MRRGIVLGKESAIGARGWSRRVALIKSLIYARKKRHAYGTGLPSSAEKSQLILSFFLSFLRESLDLHLLLGS